MFPTSHQLNPGEVVAIAVTFLLMVGLLVLLIRNGQRRREWEHAERMKALEMGLSVPPRDAPWAKAAVCTTIGAGVPMVAFIVTYLSYSSKPGDNMEIWLAPSLVSGASVLGACLLAGALFRASRLPQGRTMDDAGARHHGLDMKASHDPDALDVVGRRG